MIAARVRIPHGTFRKTCAARDRFVPRRVENGVGLAHRSDLGGITEENFCGQSDALHLRLPND